MSILQQICDKKRQHVEQRKSERSLDQLKEELTDARPLRSFKKALEKTALENNKPALITEVKKASPSAGIIRDSFDPVEIAKVYEQAGASCLSVLTDTPYFQGEDQYLVDIRAATDTPLLRKDFMINEYQIYESRLLGADCILLIMAALNDTLADRLFQTAKGLCLDVLVEVHDGQELQRAIALKADMIGVNNRNLKTLEVNLQTSINLSDLMPDDVFKIAESGIREYEDIVSLQAAGYRGFLVGESLMRQNDIDMAVTKLCGHT